MNQNLQKFGIKFKTFFGMKQEKKNKGATKEFIAKLSRGLMLPIAMLPIAGLFLGIGAAIETNAGNDAGLKLFGNFLKIPGDVIFGALPVLFAIAIAIAFTKDAGPAALSALIGFLVFSGLQSALIQPVITNGKLAGYNLLFYGPGSLGEEKFGLPTSLFGSVLGINQLSTSVFGGFIVGFTVAFLYNKFKNIQLPQIIGFFNGVRFIPIVTFTALFPITLLVLMLWPLIGTLFGIIGGALGGQMFGFNSLIFGYIERALVPFGLHHAFYSPLWYSNVGGELDLNGLAITSDGKFLSVNGTEVATWLQILKSFNPNFEGSTVAGDQVLWSFANSNLVGKQVQQLILNDGQWKAINYTIKFTDIAQIHVKSLGDLPDNIKNITNLTNGAKGVNIGQYMQGKYAFMMFGLPAAAVAMIMAAPKGNRKMAASIIGSAGLTAMLTGITEPIEFTFLFLAPWLFWGVHASLCALSFGMMNWIGLISSGVGHPELAPHIGMSFSGGLIDWIIYGGIQIQYGSNAWWSLLLGLAYAPIYFFLFLYLIKKYNIATPGRGENTKLFTKQDYLNKKNDNVENKSLQNMTQERALAIEIIKAYGGLENIKNVDACITKLRIQVEHQDIVNSEKLTSELGARGVIKPSAQSVYSIYGALADRLKNEINDIISDIEENPSLKEKYFNDNNSAKQEIKTIQKEKEVSIEKIIIKSPLDGKIIPIEEVPDETFSKSMMGAGIAIEPKNGKLTAPISGKMSLVFDTGHAYTFESKKGTQVLVHIGIDSINLKDENQKELKVFTPKVKTNDSIKIGDSVCLFKLNEIKKHAKSHITPIIVLDESLNGREVKVLKTSGTIIRGEPLLEVLPPKNVSNN